MKILFADKFPPEHLERLRGDGHECDYQPDLGAADLPGVIAGFEALVVRSTRVESDTIDAADALSLVIRAGAGTNTIDTESAAGRGVRVCNVPGKNALAVAELALGLLLAIDRNIAENVADLRAGRWNKKKYSTARGLAGRAIGVVGLGAIGMAVAERAAAFAMRVHVIDKPGRDEGTLRRLGDIDAQQVADLDELAARCEVLSFHVPASEGTKAMVNADLLERMAAGSIIINTARGEIIDEQALLNAMNAKGIRAGLDVYQGEPASGEGEFNSPLAQHPNVCGTHHIGASTEQAQTAVADGVLDIFEAYGRGRTLNCVNFAND